MELKFEVYLKVKKPVGEVFDAVYDNKKISKYFTTGGASAPLDEGTTVTWGFHDHPGSFPVQVKKMVKDKQIVLEWGNSEKGTGRVEMNFEALDQNSSKITIKESGWKNLTQESLDASYGNCYGWTSMLCFLKVYLEHGIVLREFYH